MRRPERSPGKKGATIGHRRCLSSTTQRQTKQAIINTTQRPKSGWQSLSARWLFFSLLLLLTVIEGVSIHQEDDSRFGCGRTGHPHGHTFFFLNLAIVANGLEYDGIVASVLLENTYFTQSLIDSTRHQHRTRAALDAFRDCDYPACETICGRPSVPVLAFAKSGCHPLKGIRFVAALCLPNDWPAGQKSK